MHPQYIKPSMPPLYLSSLRFLHPRSITLPAVVGGVLGLTRHSSSSICPNALRQGERAVPGSSHKEANSPLDIFALIIGINEYQHFEHLKGAVPDANAIADLLRKDLKVPTERIKLLTDEYATGSAILEELRAFKDNKQIVKDKTAILIYFAGHGSRVKAPNNWPGWKTDDGYIELLCPVDGEKGVPDSACGGELVKGECISDQRISDILRKLSDAKGNNITLICDCCHSAGLNRGDDSDSDDLDSNESDPSELVRGVDDIESNPTQCDTQPILPECGNGETREGYPNVKVPSREGFRASWDSHVFLAACLSDQKARETSEGGKFTTALLKVLKGTYQGHIHTHLTYRALASKVVAEMLNMGSQQTPFIYGKHIHRCIFTRSGEAVSRPMIPCYNVKSTNKGIQEFYLRAGHSVSVLEDSIYDIYDTDLPTPQSRPLIMAKISSINSTARLEVISAIRQGDYAGVLYARLSKYPVADLLVYCNPEKIDLFSSFNELRYPFRHIDRQDEADICLEVDAGAGNKVSISRGNTNTYFVKNTYCFDEMEGNDIFKQAQREGFPTHFSYKPLASNIDGIKQFIDAYAHFTYHLTSGSPRKIEDLVSVEMHKLKRNGDNLDVIGGDLLSILNSQDSQTRREFVEVAGDLDLYNARDNNDAPRYGLTIRRKSISSQVGTLY
ncbi:caspase domain-containing protein [Desarmillaria tabescens]|uniref:Caspase domain-containing protein n=1 Tax=Armillaria tabescens TaxID=1929756 RepID=A0AA39JIB0_ARMTA|nr:caspase domain-containing protein [Desarmillaria tabescens]KAK0442692.1 caspase domain-containing protein [Desarmillaria tabescens]